MDQHSEQPMQLACSSSSCLCGLCQPTTSGKGCAVPQHTNKTKHDMMWSQTTIRVSLGKSSSNQPLLFPARHNNLSSVPSYASQTNGQHRGLYPAVTNNISLPQANIPPHNSPSRPTQRYWSAGMQGVHTHACVRKWVHAMLRCQQQSNPWYNSCQPDQVRDNPSVDTVSHARQFQ